MVGCVIMRKQVDKVIDTVIDQAKQQIPKRQKFITSVNNITNPIVRANPLRIGHDQKVDVPVFHTPERRIQSKVIDSRRHNEARNIIRKQNR